MTGSERARNTGLRPVQAVAEIAQAGQDVLERAVQGRRTRDRGIGIAPEDLGRVFTPFFRGDRSRARDTGGVGLGLALSKRIVEAHGGRITLESQPGEGTTIRIWLPA